MKFKTKISLLVTATIVLVGFGYSVSFLGSENALMERFPDIDPDDVIAAHRKMFLAALKGEFADVDTNDEALMDHIFLSYVNNL